MPNKVVALRNGTMGWNLAGLHARQRQDQARAARRPRDGLACAKAAAERVAQRFGDQAHRAAPPRTLARATRTRTLYLFDVRDPEEYAAGHVPGAISAPGGQLVQATDQYAGTLGARIVLVDDHEVRAVMTASWLKQMGWRDVFVLAETGNEKGRPGRAGARPAAAARARHRAAALAELVAKNGNVTVIDLSLSPAYRKGHIPGAWFAIRSRLDEALAKIPVDGELVLTSEDGVLAGLAACEDARRRAPLSARRQRRLARRRPAALDRAADGRRAARRLAQALRARRTTPRAR